MNYRKFPGTDITVSALGFGCMRLPVLSTEGNPIDRAEGKRMVDRAIDGGVTYFDTAYGYHNEESEVFVGEALKGLRNRVTLTTKLPCWKVEKREDMDALLDTQIKRLQTDHVDFYLLHALNANSYDKMVSLGVFEFLDRAQAQGKIRYPGFSFHDDSATFRRIVDAYPWKLAQVQMNILDEDKQATMEGVRYAGSKGIGIVVMEPLRGGALARTLPPEVRDIYAHASVQHSAVEWAFRYLLDKSEFITILSGMSDMQQLEDNLRIFSEAGVDCLSSEQRDMLAQVRAAYENRVRVGCTGCEYCQPCPAEVPIPKIFRPYDQAAIFDNFEPFFERYAEKVGQNRCQDCGACEAACPQKIHVRDWLKRIQAEYEQWSGK